MNNPLLRKRFLSFSFLLLVLCGGVRGGAPGGEGVRREGNRVYFTPACPIIAQNFNNPADVNGATSDPDPTGWYLNASKVPNATYFAIKSHRIKAQTLGGEGVWYSQVFSIAGYTGVQIDAKVSNEGSKSSSEYVKIYHKLNGGPEILDTAMYGNMGSPTIKSAPMTGNTVQIVIRIYDTTKGNSEYYIEQYDVFKEVGPCSVSGITVSASASNSGVLTCANPSVTLSASTTASGTTTYAWTGPGGFSSSLQNPVVSAAGNYLVVGTNAAGTGSASVTVTANNAPPDVTATGGAMGCATSAVVSASSSVSGATYRWTGPGGFSSTLASPTVTAAGSYTVTVTNPATGCTASQTVAVTSGGGTPAVFWLEDFAFPNGTVSDAGNTAWTATTTGTGTYSVQNNEFKTSFSGQSEGVWTSGVINVAGKTNTVLSVDLRSETASSSDAFETTDYVRVYYKLDGGPETLVYEDLAGIGSTTTGTASVTITPSIPAGNSLQIVIRTSDSDPTERYFFDNVKLSGINGINAVASASGSLTCNSQSVLLTGSSSAAGAVYSWTGPNGFVSGVQNPTVGAPGIYTLTVTVGGCSASDTALVAQDIVSPQGLTTTSIPSASQLTCTNNSVVFTAASTTPGVTYSWTGPGGFTATGVNATATAVGSYVLTATGGTNGCTATTTATVTQNTAAPGGVTTTADPATAQITCAHPTVLLTSSSTTAGVTFSWAGPSGFTATGASATAAAPGTYTVTVTDPTNGCVTTLPGTVTRNTSVPIGLTASPSDIISCFTPAIDLQGASTTPGVVYSWAGPGGFTANTAVAETEAPGNYTLTVTNPANGCSSSTGTVVLADTATPAGVTASNDGPLNCIKTSVTLSSSSTTPNVDFLWVTPDNNFIPGASAVVTAPGAYTIVVTNDDNGCTTQAVTTVVRNTTGCVGGAGTSGSAVSAAGGRMDLATETEFSYKVYPNPFSSSTLITFRSPAASQVTVEVYNSVGVKEKLLFNKTVNAGQTYSLELGAAGLSPGTHFCVIQNNRKVYTTKLLMVR
ncbi:MAG TPA: T9SS type A sorting domain-containing protein [Puia sp.]